MNLTLQQIQDMKHAIGFRRNLVKKGKYKAYRKHYTTSMPDESWEELVVGGYAKVRQFPQGRGQNPMIYHVTAEGLKVLEQILEVDIKEED